MNEAFNLLTYAKNINSINSSTFLSQKFNTFKVIINQKLIDRNFELISHNWVQFWIYC
jgi:hypothetical protein